ncbi:MAG: hypothetical protein FWD32_02550 [Firmicutes bacterium]|nr:hypothetical protein [Bacillota bacterium]
MNKWQEKYLKECNAYVCVNSVVGASVDIGVGCVITNSTIEDGAQVLPYCVIDSSTIESGASVGPFSFVRPQTVLRDGSKVGAFVEIKKSTIGRNSKVPHLVYVGDAEIGEGSNIGCGTVVCNYDGVNKHKTVIGNNCFIGSNSNLIAPINIGDNAMVAAGSTLNMSVENGMFAIARARQENREMPEKIKQIFAKNKK